MTRWTTHPDWSDPTARLLHDALADAFWEKPDLKEIWQTIGMSPADIDWTGTARMLWRALTRDAAAAGRLEALIGEVSRRKPAVADRLKEVLAAELPDTAWYVCPDRYRARLFGPGFRRALFDRTVLSSALRSLSAEDYPVLCIQGDSGSGKSYSRHLIQYVAATPGIDANLLVLEIEEEWAVHDEIEVVDFVCRLARRLGLRADFDPDRDTETHRTARELTSEFVGRFAALPGIRRWIFIDGLDRSNVGRGVTAFVTNLAREVEMNQLGDTRLIITGHAGDFSPSVQDVLLSERIEPVDARDVELFFADIADHVGTVLEPTVLRQLVKDVLSEASLVDLRSLSRQASRVAHRYFAKNGTA